MMVLPRRMAAAESWCAEGDYGQQGGDQGLYWVIENDIIICWFGYTAIIHRMIKGQYGNLCHLLYFLRNIS